MSKTREEYTTRMGYMPYYKFPEQLEIFDEEFIYYKVRVPRLYIKDHIESGKVWPHDVDTDIVGTLDDSVVLGVFFLPVYTGVEYLEEDDDFLYYKVRVPAVFSDYYKEVGAPTIRGIKLKNDEIKETKTGLFEITFTCKSCGYAYTEIGGDDLFRMLYERDCPYCYCTSLDVKSKAIVGEDMDGD